MKNKIINIFLVLILLCGIGVLSYPFISNILQDRKQDQILTEYNEEMEKLSDAEIEDAKEKAKQYNDSLSNTVVISDPFDPDAADDMSADYISALNLEKNGIMAYIEIPRIDVYEPVYHGTSEEVLAKGVGHLEGTSLPIGGESTHTVLSGHTGLPEAEIFTKLESVKEGDIFLIHVLNETLAYKVDQIKVVEPSETDDLKIVPGYDYATLVTCTPYGINSHRLLVRGIRTEYTQDVSDEAAGQAEEGPDGGGWKAMYEKAIIEGILFAVILVVLINVIVRKFGKKNKSEVAIYDEKEKKEKKKQKNRTLMAIMLIILYLGGLFVYAIPDLQKVALQKENEKAVEHFKEEVEGSQLDKGGEETDSTSADSNQIPKNAQLYQEMQAYNQQIFSDGQSGLTDPWSYEQETLDLSKYGIDDGMIGILDIPKMDVTLPLYLGATQEKMARGAVMLGQTSFPVQGTDSNCVIAAHRGWKGIPMFREIERLEIGDELTIQNCQETLTYRVSEIEIILPDESDKIMIQPGRNMVTLMTCHPYTQNSRRYVVYCDEVGTQPEAAVDAAEEADSSQQEIITTSEQNRTEAIEEDQRLIERDTLWRKAGYVGIGLIGVLIIFGFIPRKKH